jgi:anti-sigma factor RsiW
MRCYEIRFQLPDFVSDKISVQEKTGVENHLTTCAACRHEVETLHALFAKLETSTSQVPPQTYWASLLPQIHERMERRMTMEFPSWATRFALPLAAAIVIVVFLVKIFPWSGELESQNLQALLHQLELQEIQQVAEEQTYIGVFEPGVVQETQTTSSDKEVVYSILQEEYQASVLSDIDPQEVVESLNDQAVDKFLSILQQRSSID